MKNVCLLNLKKRNKTKDIETENFVNTYVYVNYIY